MIDGRITCSTIRPVASLHPQTRFPALCVCIKEQIVVDGLDCKTGFCETRPSGRRCPRDAPDSEGTVASARRVSVQIGV
jgi:hypothetical protein